MALYPSTVRCAAAAVLIAALAAGAGAQAQVRFHGEANGASVKVRSWRDIPFRSVVRQQHDYSCGSAALATLLTYHYGHPTTEAEAFTAMFASGDQAKIQKVGFSMLDMKRYLAAHRIDADGFRMSLEDLRRSGQPAIVLIDLGRYRHFVVVKGVVGDKILVGDPALGLQTYEVAQFRKIWNGIVFSIRGGDVAKTPVFNQASEWNPWSTAPRAMARSASMIDTLTLTQPALYQISPVRDLSSISVGIRP